MKAIFSVGAALLLVALIGCSKEDGQETEGAGSEPVQLAHYALDNMSEIETLEGVTPDSAISSDGAGSLRIEVVDSTTVALLTVAPIDAEDCRLIYRADLRAENFQGQAYLEMWCDFDEQGSYFSRGLQNPITGDIEWTSVETYFFLKAGENPDRVRLGLVVDGAGTIWIDNVQLLKGPLE